MAGASWMVRRFVAGHRSLHRSHLYAFSPSSLSYSVKFFSADSTLPGALPEPRRYPGP